MDEQELFDNFIRKDEDDEEEKQIQFEQLQVLLNETRERLKKHPVNVVTMVNPERYAAALRSFMEIARLVKMHTDIDKMYTRQGVFPSMTLFCALEADHFDLKLDELSAALKTVDEIYFERTFSGDLRLEMAYRDVYQIVGEVK